MSIKATNWAWDAFESGDLTPTEGLILLALAHFHNAKTGRCDPSYKRIAERVRKDRGTVIRAVKSLSEKGIVDPVKRTGRKGSMTTQFELEGVAQLCHPGGVAHTRPPSAQGGGGAAMPPKREVNYTQERPTPDLKIVSGGRNV